MNSSTSYPHIALLTHKERGSTQDKGKSCKKTIRTPTFSFCILRRTMPYGTPTTRKNGEKNGMNRRKMQDESYTRTESYTLSYTRNRQ